MSIVDIQTYDPDSIAPPAEVIAIMEDGLVQITRRAEFYEADAVTRWFPDPNDPLTERLVDGSVNVDYNADERRKLDITFDNIDRLLRPNPDGGFWYDKVIKVYRGVSYDPRDVEPHLAIIEAEWNDNLVGLSYVNAFNSAGFRDNTLLLGQTDPSILKDYSWIVSGMKYSPTKYASTLTTLWNMGKNIITFGTGNDSTQVPHYTAYNRVTNLLKAHQQAADQIDTALGWKPTFWAGSVPSIDTVNPLSGSTGSLRTDVTSAPLSSQGRAATDKIVSGGGGFTLPGTGINMYCGITVRNDSVNTRTFDFIIETMNAAGTSTLEDLTIQGSVSIASGETKRLFGTVSKANALSTQAGVILLMNGAAIGDAFTVDDAWVSTASPSDFLAGITPVTADTPTTGTFTTESSGVSGPGVMPTAITAGVQTLAVWTNAGLPQFITAAIMRNPNGAVWIDVRLPVLTGTQAKAFLRALLGYVRNYYGIKTWEAQLGEFYIDNITQANFPDQLKVTARDATKKLMNDKLSRTATFVVGTSLEDFVIGQAALAGIPVNKMRFNMAGETLTTELSFDKGTSRWDMIKGALNSFNYEFFFNGQGFFVIRPFNDPTLSPIDFSFGTGPQGNLVTFEKAVNDSRIYNVVQVTSDPSDSADIPISYFGEARNDDLSSPTNTTRLGNRVLPVDAPWLNSDEDCAALAGDYLKISALESYELNFTSIYYPWLEAGGIIEILDPEAYSFEPTRFLMDTIDYALGLQPMAATGKRVTFVGEAN